MAVEAINRKASLVLMVGGATVPIACWLDARGDECDEPDAAFAVAGPSAQGRWHTLDLADFVTVATN